MKLRSHRAFAITCVGLWAFASAAAAQHAPIVYAAGQGGSSAPSATETALASPGLAGGDDNSYGYGSTSRRRGAVIDIRRPGSGAARVQQVADTYPAPLPAAEEPPAAAPPPATETTPEQGAQPWLERERVGPPYQANGRWYVPTPEPGYQQTGVASWYGPTFNGQRTASGEVFDQTALTAAHPTLPIPSLVQVTNLQNGREVIVRVNDRGPFVGERLIDLSQGAAQVLGFEQAGQTRVHIRYLGPAPRRVNADGTPAPASAPSPAPVSGPVETASSQGPTSLLPNADDDLAGAPVETAEEAPQPAYAAPAAAGDYFVQVGAYSDLGNAHRVRDEVGAAGPVMVDTRRTAAGAELFRVRVGPWTSRDQADAARRTLASLGYGETIVAAR